MDILRIAAFTDHGQGGNPAGVVIAGQMPPAEDMLAIAAQVGYSETAFLAPAGPDWRVRYFAPQVEVPFCGHATIAAGAVLGERFGPGAYRLLLNQGQVQVRAIPAAIPADGGGYAASLRSVDTWSQPAPADYLAQVLDAFHWTPTDLDPRYPPAIAFAGAKHLLLALASRQALAGMAYPFEPVRALMLQQDLTTISLLWAEPPGGEPPRFHARNAFPVGGVYEDPATGAAAAALGGYLRDIAWPGPERFEILQGHDMGIPSRLQVAFTRQPGAPVEVSGETRQIG